MLEISNFVLELVNKEPKYYEKSNDCSRFSGFGDGNLDHMVAQFGSTKNSRRIFNGSHTNSGAGFCSGGCG